MSVEKLYESVLKYGNKCDFGTIPKSKGDITKVDGIEDTVQCLDILNQLHTKHNIPIQDIADIRTVISAITRLKRSFEFGFKTNNDYLIITYNTIVMAVLDATSNLIADYTSYMVTPNDVQYQGVSKSNKKRESVSIDTIRRFAKLSADGTLDSTVNSIVNIATKRSAGTRTTNDAVVTESLTVAVVITAGILLGIKLIIEGIRSLIFGAYNSRVKVAEYLEMQATFLEMNRLVVENTNRPASQKEKILKNQEKVILKLRRLADKIKINSEDMSAKGDKLAKQENATFTLAEMEKQAASNSLNGSSIQII